MSSRRDPSIFAAGRQSSSLGEATMRLRGKVALVTGAQQGIGRAIALAFAREGADVGVNYLDDRGAAEKIAQEIRGIGRRAVLVEADVAQPAGAQAMVSQVAG